MIRFHAPNKININWSKLKEIFKNLKEIIIQDYNTINMAQWRDQFFQTQKYAIRHVIRTNKGIQCHTFLFKHQLPYPDSNIFIGTLILTRIARKSSQNSNFNCSKVYLEFSFLALFTTSEYWVVYCTFSIKKKMHWFS